MIENVIQLLKQSAFLVDRNTSLTVLTLLLSILIFWRALVLRKRTEKQNAFILEQSKSLHELQTKLQKVCEKRERDENFQKNLKHAEVTTELQKHRSGFVHQRAPQRPPERYGYATSMFRSGMTVAEISSALGMSQIELNQLLKLDSLCGSMKSAMDSSSPGSTD